VVNAPEGDPATVYAHHSIWPRKVDIRMYIVCAHVNNHEHFDDRCINSRMHTYMHAESYNELNRHTDTQALGVCVCVCVCVCVRIGGPKDALCRDRAWRRHSVHGAAHRVRSTRGYRGELGDAWHGSAPAHPDALRLPARGRRYVCT
jgi:hypothetical protein